MRAYSLRDISVEGEDIGLVVEKIYQKSRKAEG
jgi:hypothetical protein